jgi:hypothetical protein
MLRRRPFAFDGRIGLSDTVILASMARSGSTLVSNIINCDNTYRILFEPFRFDLVDAAKDFVYPFYLRPDNTDPRFFHAAQEILAGKVHSKWVDKENRAVFPKKRLIKDIRINMILKWLHNCFPEVKIVFLVRHPCAVVESWMAVRYGKGIAALNRLCTNEMFVEDIRNSILGEYRKAKSDFESLVFFWCVSHWVPFHQFHKDELYLIFYEDLLIDPKAEFEHLFSFLGHTYSPQKAFSAFSKPSSTVRQDNDTFLHKSYTFDSWMAKISPQQLDRAYEIMSLFGLEEIYSPITAKPNREAALNLFGSI